MAFQAFVPFVTVVARQTCGTCYCANDHCCCHHRFKAVSTVYRLGYPRALPHRYATTVSRLLILGSQKSLFNASCYLVWRDDRCCYAV